jgi:hypothetical protein
MLTLKPKPGINLKIKTKEEGVYYETEDRFSRDSVLVAKGDGWSLFIEPYNIVYREGSRYKYYSNFEQFFEAFKTSRMKYWLTKEERTELLQVIHKINKDIQFCCDQLEHNLDFLSKFYVRVK